MCYKRGLPALVKVYTWEVSEVLRKTSGVFFSLILNNHLCLGETHISKLLYLFHLLVCLIIKCKKG